MRSAGFGWTTFAWVSNEHGIDRQDVFGWLTWLDFAGALDRYDGGLHVVESQSWLSRATVPIIFSGFFGVG
jgi:hypothetical protein